MIRLVWLVLLLLLMLAVQTQASETLAPAVPNEPEPVVIQPDAPGSPELPFPNTLRGANGVNSYLLNLIDKRDPDSPFAIQYEKVGRSRRGIPVYMFTIAGTEASTEQQGGLMVVARQHGDEPAGTRAMVELIRRIATGSDEITSDSLDGVVVRIIPIANPDGMDLFTRRTSNNKDMNRDWNSLSLPETRAIANAISQHKPEALMDLHEMMPRDHDRSHMIGVPLTRASRFLYPMKRALADRSLPARTRTRERSNTTTLLHRNFAARYGRPGFLIESQSYWDATVNLQNRTEYHITAVMAVIEELGKSGVTSGKADSN